MNIKSAKKKPVIGRDGGLRQPDLATARTLRFFVSWQAPNSSVCNLSGFSLAPLHVDENFHGFDNLCSPGT